SWKAAAWWKSVPCCRQACDGAARASVPAGSGAVGRHADAHLRGGAPGAGRRRRAGRLLPRPRGVAVPRRAGRSIRLAHGHGEASGARRAAAGADRAHARPGGRANARDRRAVVYRRRHQGRSAAHDVFLLPSATVGSGAGGAHAPHPVRVQRGRGGRRVREHPRRRGEASHARQARARPVAAAVRDRGPGRLRRAAPSRAARALSALQRLLERSAGGPDLTEYHLEAAIPAVHASAPRLEDTNWGDIVSLYDMLLAIRPSPVVALNRAIALAQRDGPEPGLAAIAAIADRDRLANYPFYHAALGELELRRGQGDAARGHFAAALALARNATERQFLAQRMQACDAGKADLTWQLGPSYR